MIAPVEISSLVVEIKKDVDADVRLRTARAIAALVGAIKENYARPQGLSPEGVRLGFTASHGASGAIGAINYDVTQAERFIEATIGLSDSARYLRNIEFGEAGTQGAPVTGAIFTRGLAPPMQKIYEWLKLAHLTTPDYFKDRAERFRKMAESTHKHPVFDANRTKPWYSTDEVMQYAYAIAMKRKRLGRPAMRLIEKTAQAYTEKIRLYLAGSTA